MEHPNEPRRAQETPFRNYPPPIVPYDPNYRPPSPPPEMLVSHQRPAGVVSAKNGGIAVLLDLVWAGAGHVYAGKPVLGLICMFVIVPILWALVVLTAGIGLVLAVPIWVSIMVHSWYSVKGYNERNGIEVR